MAHKTAASGEYPWPPEVARIIYDYYFDAPEILAAENEFYALCVDGTLHVCPQWTGPFTCTDIESIASNDLDGLSACVVIKRTGEVFTRGHIRAANALLTQEYLTQVYLIIADAMIIADATAFTPERGGREYSVPDVTDIGRRPLIRVVSSGASFLGTIDTGDVVTWGETYRGRFVDRGYADAINEHQMSIRVAFKNATGIRAR